MNKMLVIGITGGVGSGKSTISKILEKEYGAYIINTDEIAHDLMEKGKISYNLIVDHFGKSILDDNGNIDRQKLSKIVYKSENELIKLNSFSHPYVMEEVLNIIKKNRAKNYPYTCIETALPVEANLKSMCDKIWFIYSPDEVRRDRLKRSRKYSDKKIRDIMSRQLSNEEYKKYSTDVIMNVSLEEDIIKQIDKMLGK